MAILNFPSNPSNGTVYRVNGVTYTYVKTNSSGFWSANNNNFVDDIFVNTEGDVLTGQLLINNSKDLTKPPLAFAGDVDTGFISEKENEISLVVGGKVKFNVNSTGHTNFSEHIVTQKGYHFGEGKNRIVEVNGNQLSFIIDDKTRAYVNKSGVSLVDGDTVNITLDISGDARLAKSLTVGNFNATAANVKGSKVYEHGLLQLQKEGNTQNSNQISALDILLGSTAKTQLFLDGSASFAEGIKARKFETFNADAGDVFLFAELKDNTQGFRVNADGTLQIGWNATKREAVHQLISDGSVEFASGKINFYSNGSANFAGNKVSITEQGELKVGSAFKVDTNNRAVLGSIESDKNDVGGAYLAVSNAGENLFGAIVMQASGAFSKANTATLNAFNVFHGTASVAKVGFDGSATFAGSLKSGDPKVGAKGIGLSAGEFQTNSYSLNLYTQTNSSNAAVFSIYSQAAGSSDDLTRKIEFGADGSSSFTGRVLSKANVIVDGGSSGGFASLDNKGSHYSVVNVATDVVFQGGSKDDSDAVKILGEGSATFAKGITALSLKGQTAGSDAYTAIDGAGLTIIDSKGGTAVSLKTDGDARFEGDIFASGISSATGNAITSDQRFKTNITPANPQLEDVKALGASLKNYDWLETAPVHENHRSRRFLGLIAQEAQAISPQITHEIPITDENGEEDTFLAIDKTILVMKLLGAAAELAGQLTTLESNMNIRIAELEQRITDLEPAVIYNVIDAEYNTTNSEVWDESEAPIFEFNEEIASWVYTNAGGSIHWIFYQYDSNNYEAKVCKLKDIQSLFMKLRNLNENFTLIPRIEVFTQPLGDAEDASTEYRSRIIYEQDFIGYQPQEPFIAWAESDPYAHDELEYRYELPNAAIAAGFSGESNEGPQDSEEVISKIVVTTDSEAFEGDYSFALDEFGFITTDNEHYSYATSNEPPVPVVYIDEDGDGFADGEPNYKLMGTYGQVVDLSKDGNIITRDQWDHTLHAIIVENGYRVLIIGGGQDEGLVGVWEVDSTGARTEGSGWKTLEEGVELGWEEVFSYDINADQIIGVPPVIYQELPVTITIANSAQAVAGSNPPVEVANYDGWGYENPGNSGKIHWYFFSQDPQDPNATTYTLGDVESLFLKLRSTHQSLTTLPHINVYTLPYGDGNDAQSWYRSRCTYEATADANLINGDAPFVTWVGQQPHVYTDLPHTELVKQGYVSEGPQDYSEMITLIAVSSNSAADAGDYDFIMEELGFVTTDRRYLKITTSK